MPDNISEAGVLEPVSAGTGPDGRFFIRVAVDTHPVVTVCLPASLASEYFDGGSVYAIAAPTTGADEVIVAFIASNRTDIEPVIADTKGEVVGTPAPDLTAYVATITLSDPVPERLRELVETARAGEVASGTVRT